MVESLIFDMEVDVVRDRSIRPWRERTHHVIIAVADRPSMLSAENEARTMAAFMCWHVRGQMVTAVRIIGAEL